jgi:hypothetical protein
MKKPHRSNGSLPLQFAAADEVSNTEAICCNANVRFWHISSIRGTAALLSLSERSGHRH